MSTPGADVRFAGNDRLLVGMILGVLTFWLFAHRLDPADHPGRETRTVSTRH